MAGDNGGEFGSFPSTHWSLIFSARKEDLGAGQGALNDLLRRYRPALLAHLCCRRRVEYHRAEDLVQGFIESKILERDLLGRADPAKGHFRSFLLKSLENYVRDQACRGGPPVWGLNLDGEDGRVPDGPVANVFEVEWARQLLKDTLCRMHAECVSRGRSAVWDFFECRVVVPALAGSSPPSYKTLIERFGYSSAEEASNALVNAKRQFRRTLRSVLGEVERVATEEEFVAELADLCGILQAGPLGLDWNETIATNGPSVVSGELDSIDGTTPRALLKLLGVEGTRDHTWHSAELGEILDHHLATLVGDYLQLSEEEHDESSGALGCGVSRTTKLGDLLQLADPPLDLLVAVKRHARHNARVEATGVPIEVHRAVYFGSIAAALVHCGTRISKLDEGMLRSAMEQLVAEPWGVDWLRDLFAAAVEKLSGPNT